MPDLKRSLAIRPTYTRQISEQSTMEMASPLSTIPPPSVLDQFERNPVRNSTTLPVRRNTEPVLVAGRVWNIPKPLVKAAGALAPHWRELATGLALSALTAWMIALTVKVNHANGIANELWDMPFCDDTPQFNPGIMPPKRVP